MANRRMLSKNISYSKQVNSVSDFSKLLFTWVIPHLDDFGRIDGDPRVLKAMVMPMSARKEEEFEDSILELVKEGLIDRYVTNKGKVIHYPTFDIYQTGLGKRTKSKYLDINNNEISSDNFLEIQGNYSLTEPNRTEKKINELNLNEPNIAFNINNKEFVPNSEGECAAYEAFITLEPDNEVALEITYLRALKLGLPPKKFYEFSSEIKHDKSIKNFGAVFNKKVEEYMKNK